MALHRSQVSLDGLDVNLLRLFCTIVECNGFSAAQAQANISAASISSKMATLEARLGLRLCQRGRAGFKLTREGEMVYQSAASIFYAHDSFVRDINQLRKKLTGRLNIGVVDSTVTNPHMPLSAAIGRFHDKHGDVYIALHVQEPAQLEKAILDGGMHLGIAPFYQHVPGLIYTSLFEERHQLYCAKGHPLFEKAPDDVELSSLLNSKYVLRSHVPSKIELPTDKAVDTASVSDMEAMAHLILSGRFIGFLPAHYARTWTETGRFRPLLPARLAHVSRFEVAIKRERKQERLVRAFLQELVAKPVAGQAQRADGSISATR